MKSLTRDGLLLKIVIGLSLCILSVTAAKAQTVVSAGFENGVIGEYTNNAHQPERLQTFVTLGIAGAVVSDITDNGLFGGSQGNDYSVTLTFQFTDGSTYSFPASVNWRDTTGSIVHGIGLTVSPGTIDGTSYVASSGLRKTYLLQLVGDTRVYTDTGSGDGGVVTGNAANNGLLEALNEYADGAPPSAEPSSLTSTIAALPQIILANGTSTSAITVQLKDINGNNLTTGGDIVTLSATAGSLSEVVDNGDGSYTAILTSSVNVGIATITGTANNLAIVNNATVEFIGNTPSFTNTNSSDASGDPSYNFDYAEGSTTTDVIGQVFASDPEGDVLTFSITAGNADDWYKIDASTGEITLTETGVASAANDHEQEPNTQALTVTVSDGTNSAAVEVTLNETDLDDAAPLITGPSGGEGAAQSAISINEGETAVASFTANEDVTWSITGGDDQGKFEIATDGTLTFVAAPDFESPTDSDTNNTYVVLVSAADVNGNVSTQMLTVTVLNVDEIARKLDQIGGQLRTGLRAYAVHGLSDMLSFNESMMRGHNDDLCSDRKVFSGFARGDENGGSVDLQYSRRLAECSRRHQVRVDAGLSYSKIEGDWNSRIFAGLRYETKIDQDFTLGLAALASQSSDKLIGFEQSSISDKSLQATAYGRYWISDTLRTGAFFGFGKTWYNFSLIDSDDFSLAGSMRGNRQLYGWLMSGEWVIGDTVLTTDAIISHAKEKLGSASLSANYMGEKRTNIDLAVGTVDVTRISLPVTAPVVLSGSSEEYGEFSRLLLSPGVICEDNSADSSSMRCGYQAGAKLIVKDDSGRNHFYADYRWENVSGIQRSLFGVGYAYRFGRRNELELAIDLNRAQDNEDRAFVSLRLAQ